MNTISITGRITADIELKQTTTAISVCRFTLAVKRPKVKDTTDFIACTAWRQTAELISKYLKKGSQVGISGSLTTRHYEVGEKKMTAYEVLVDDVTFLDSRTGNSSQVTSSGDEGINTPSETKTQQSAKFAVTEPQFEEIDDDGNLPF